MDVGVQVSEQQQIFEALEESEARFRLLADGAPVGIFQTDSRGRCRFVNRRWRDLTGQELEQAHGGGWARAVHPDDRERVVAAWNEAARLGDEFALECRVLHTKGHSHWVFARGCPVTDADGRLKGYVGTVTAIDEVKRAEEALERSERRYRHLVESSLGLICTHDLEGRLLSVNPAAATALGYEADELVGRNLRELLAPSVRDRFTDYLGTIREQGETTGWMRIRTRSGEERLWAYRNSVYGEEGEPLYVLGHAHDITELHRAERAGRLLAIQDEVTGLLNRRGFETVLENRLVQAAEQGTPVELVLINPDDFEVVNDRFGRATGDRALEEIARVLAGFESEAAAVCRYGGAVFTLVREIGDLEPRESLRRMEEVRASLGRREYLDGTVRFAFSTGIARLDPSREGLSDDSALQLVRRADEALQQAKMDGGGCTVVWTPEVETEQSGFRDRLSGIFTANLAKDYRNMLLLWDTVTVVARNPDFEELTEKVLEGLRASFKPERVALFAAREATSPRLVRGLSREPESWNLGPEELRLIETAAQQRTIQHNLGTLTGEPGGAGAPETGAPEPDKVAELTADRRVCFAIPLVARGKCLGCLYLDGRTDRMSLDVSDRVFLEALADRLAVAFARAERVEQDRRRQAAERRRLREEIDGLSQALQRAKLVVRSPEMEEVLDQARRVAPTDATVLIHGPSGTGKEVLARTLHELSPRRRNPPVVVDCTAIAPSLIESELFGHERGAFTGADQRRSGRLAEAEGSTLILDEIGELPLSVQSKLLRFVQEQELMTVGGRRVHKVDTRVIALTHRDLAAEAAAGRFREDLFHRLNVVRLTVPPLADRPDDILGLARHFVTTFSSQHRKEIRGLAEESEAALLQHPWPGNVRELQNRILRAVILHEEEWILPEDLGLGPDSDRGDGTAETVPAETAPSESGAPASSGPSEGGTPAKGAWSHLREALASHVEAALADGAEKRFPLGRWISEDLVLEAMEGAGSQREAAETLGIPETTFRRRLSKARTEVESGRAVRSPTWGRVRRALRELIRGVDDPPTLDGEEELPDPVRSETALPERVRFLLLHEVEERVDGSPRRGATLMGVTEPTYRRWVSGE